VTLSERTLSTHGSPSPRREIDVRAIWRAVLRHKTVVGVTVVVVTALAVAYALTATLIFRGEATVVLVHDTGAGGLGAIAGQFGGLASLAGLNLNESGQDRERLALLQSRRLVEEFIKRNGVLELMAHDAKQPPTLWLAVEKFRSGSVRINEDKLKGVITVSIDWTDPQTAARWTNAYVQLANDLLRAKAVGEASRNVDYLKEEVAQNNVLELQRVFYNLIEQETKTLMLANGRVDYAFTIVDPAVPPEKRVSPKRTYITLSGAILGFLLGSALALVVDAVQLRRRNSAVVAS
jgi:uncharacterized protein involved in exopolysaccharide biosynthesis